MIKILKEKSSRPLVFDGAMGTMVQLQGVREGDFGGYPGVNEILNVVSPAIVGSVHRSYLDAGSDVIITNTFGASRISLAEHGLERQAFEINAAAARVAREAADEVAVASGRRRFVAGELGPTTKLPSLGHIAFSEMEAAYLEQAAALIEGKVDCIIVTTSQDPLQVKAAASAARQAMDEAGRSLPLIISVTVERSGTMLVGTRLSAALASIEPYLPDAFGINCAIGPDGMEEHLAELARISPIPIICQPNAGLPENRNGKAYYPLGADEFAARLRDFVERFGIRMVGGCCGTTPDHIAKLSKATSDVSVPTRDVAYAPQCASLFSAVALDQEPKPLIVAEQTNSNGSRKFREMVAAEDWDGCIAHARRAAGGAHVLDVAVALPGADECASMNELIPRLVASIDRPLVIDSTRVDAMEAALAHIGGRAIINSINLEDGGDKAKRVVALAKRFGALVVCLTIDEGGMAATAEQKLTVAKRIVDLAVSGGLRREDLLIDPLVFTLASGDGSTSRAAIETVEGMRLIKENIEGVRVSLGISNVSFGLPPRGRKALTSYFLHRAVDAGLDAAIINARTIVPFDRIDPELMPWVERLVDDDHADGDPLTKLLELVAKDQGTKSDSARAAEKLSPVEELGRKVIDGDRSDLEPLIARVLETMEPRAVVNDVLMHAMKNVGERFGAGTMPLPFVLQSAETMRAAIDVLSPHLKSDDVETRGTIVLATVRGDVHDIGKNLVDAILSNNGFHVVNIGIRQSAQNVMEAVSEHGADAIGLSGLLVSSTEIMREDLELFRLGEITIPVLCGGAALTDKFTRDMLAPAYGSSVYYCADAFDGLKAMEKVCNHLSSAQR